MKLEQEIRWLNETDCGTGLEILDFQIKDKDKILTLRKGLELIQMSIYGKNFNYLYNVLGSDSDLWLKKQIVVKQEQINGKNVRTITNAK